MIALIIQVRQFEFSTSLYFLMEKFQSLIPITLMYIPILILFVTPMIRIAAGPYVNIAIATVAIYPPVDQFAIIYVIKDFRTAVKS